MPEYKFMKISLVFPLSIYQTKQIMPPLGIAWLAAVLRENGYKDVYLIDAVVNKYSNEDIINLLKKDVPDIIGLSFGTQNRFYGFDLARLIKKNFPEMPIVAGGAHPTLTADDTLKNNPDIDFVIRGEGEYAFLDFIKTLDKHGDLSSVKGLSFRDKDGQIIHNPAREPIQNLDELPMPARDLLPIDSYKQKIPFSDKICTSMMTSRGCPHNCIYCSVSTQWGHKIRHHSPKNVVDEIEYLMKTYKLDGIGFFDAVFTMDRERVIKICKEILNRKLNIAWWCEARADTVDREMLEWMKKSGCKHISMAIESGSNKILKNIKKSITVEQGIEAAKMIKQIGIKLKIFFMYGLPGETYKDIKKTVFLSRHLEHAIGVDEVAQSLTIVYPGTELEKIAKTEGTLDKNFSWSRNYEEKRCYRPLDACNNMPIFEQRNLTYEQIFQYVRKAKIAYYLRHPFHALRSWSKYKRTIKEWFSTRIKKQ